MRKFNLQATPKACVPEESGMAIWAMDKEKPELMIMDDIGETWTGDGVRAVDCIEFLNEHAGQEVHARINSFGGSVYEGMVIYNAFLEHGNVIGTVEGIAFSAASIIAAGCKTLRMKKSSDIGIHRAWTIAVGNSNNMKGVIEWLDVIDQHQIETFVEKTGQNEAQIEAWLDGTDDGTVFAATKALELGFCDEVIERSAKDEPASKRTKAVKAAWQRMYRQRKRALAKT